MDLFCAHYQGKDDGDSVMDRLDPHRDGSLISFTIVLSSPDDYEGGGTEFDALTDAVGSEYDEFKHVLQNGVLKVRTAGEGVIHCGKIKHGAHVVVSGERTTLTGFVQVEDRCVRSGVLREAVKNWGRMDNAKKRLDRQSKMAGNDGDDDGNVVAKGGWVLSRALRLLMGVNNDNGRSHIEGVAPAFTSVRRRGNEEFQRKQNLATEDLLLRDMLLPIEERKHPSEMFDLTQFGDITIL